MKLIIPDDRRYDLINNVKVAAKDAGYSAYEKHIGGDLYEIYFARKNKAIDWLISSVDWFTSTLREIMW